MKIEHVAVYVKDLEKAKNFFVKYFNATAGARYHNKNVDFSSYFLSFDNGARLEIMHKPDLNEVDQQQPRMGYIHLAFSLGSKEEVDKLTTTLVNDGYHVVSAPRTTGDGYYESCIQDSEGNIIELTV